ncbi:hypothetical protein QJS66_04210 [Kocuria rhizophila]|nr:hypothetical protein QJS66_04210 [Kocuria rhizophila]
MIVRGRTSTRSTTYRPRGRGRCASATRHGRAARQAAAAARAVQG